MSLAAGSDPAGGTWVTGLFYVAAGVALLIGILTPIAATLVGVITAATWASIIPAPNPNLFATIPSIALLAVIAAAVILLGPGAFSLDARLFGLREIIIPPSRSVELHDRATAPRLSAERRE